MSSSIKKNLENGWDSLNDRVAKLALLLLNNLPKVKIDNTKEFKQKTYCYSLFVRALHSFHGMRIMLDNELLIEAATLARNCVENIIYLSAIIKDVNVLKDLEKDELHSIKTRLTAVIETASRIDPKLVGLNKLQTELEQFKQLNGNKSTIKGVAEKSKNDVLHIYFRYLSALAVHPSQSSIEAGYTTGKDAKINLGELNILLERKILYFTLISSVTALSIGIADILDMHTELDYTEELQTIGAELVKLTEMNN